MTRRIEVTAKTVDEAVEKALKEFNTTRENVEVYVVEEGSKGIFGFGAKDAKVRVSFDEEKIENVKISISAEDISEAKNHIVTGENNSMNSFDSTVVNARKNV